MSILIKDLEKTYENLFRVFDAARKAPQVKVEFYPYVGINNRIRLRDRSLIVRLSDVLRDAPAAFHGALAQILVRKLFRRRVLKNDLEIYRNYLKRTEIHEQSVENRRARGRKIVTTAKGSAYDLDEIFDFLNQIYFQNSLPKPVLTWSAKKTFRILGHHDRTHETIAVSRSLDDGKVPRFIVEFIVYHEMLHIKHPTEIRNGRRYSHTPAFRRDEENFAYFTEAENWIEQNAAALKRRAKR